MRRRDLSDNPPERAVSTLGPAAVELLAREGYSLDPWQRQLLDRLLAVDAAGRWTYAALAEWRRA